MLDNYWMGWGKGCVCLSMDQLTRHTSHCVWINLSLTKKIHGSTDWSVKHLLACLGRILNIKNAVRQDKKALSLWDIWKEPRGFCDRVLWQRLWQGLWMVCWLLACSADPSLLEVSLCLCCVSPRIFIVLPSKLHLVGLSFLNVSYRKSWKRFTFFFWCCWSLNLGLCTCQVGAPLPEHTSTPFCSGYFWDHNLPILASLLQLWWQVLTTMTSFFFFLLGCDFMKIFVWPWTTILLFWASQ
jgi:hypothetical protein